MIVSKSKINRTHHIGGIIPDWLIVLPLKKDEVFEQTNVTCIFSIYDYLNPSTLIPVGVEHYNIVNNKILEDARFNGKVPSYVYVFRGIPFNIEKTRVRLLRL